MKKIKIAMLVCRLEFGGVESVILNYTDNMTKSNYEFHIITQDINDENCVKLFENKGFKVYKICHKRKSIFRNVRELYRIFKTENYDIVHSHMTLTNFYALFIAKLCGVKVRISHSHNSLESTNFVKTLVYGILRCLNCRYATHFFACGQDAADFLFGTKNRNKVYIFPNAIETERYRFSVERRNEIRAKYHIGERTCVGHVGRFMEQKNQFFLIDIFARYVLKDPKSVLLIVGDGELKSELISHIKTLHLEDSVIMTGNINNVNEVYSAMDMFLLPSLFEGLPVVAVEAQAAGLPCLLSDRIDKRCKLTDDVAFFSIDGIDSWVEAMLKVDKQKRLPYCEKTIHLPGYDLKEEAAKMEKLYLQCCSGR